MSEIVEILADPDADMAIFADALMLDPASSYPFRPSISINPARVATSDRGDSIGNDISSLVRRKRQQRYVRRIEGGWDGPRLIAEGDSWLQFSLVRDLISQLDFDHAIYCLGEPGNLLDNVARQSQICDAIFEHNPHAILVSAGGSDLLSGPQFRAFARSYHELQSPTDLAECAFVHFIRHDLMPRLVSLIRKFRSVDARIPIIFHSYAYVIPRGSIWLGIPLHGQGIHAPTIQREFVTTIIDLFYTLFVETLIVESLGNVHIIDCRNVVGAEWFDEIHPNHRGFKNIALRYREILAKIM